MGEGDDLVRGVSEIQIDQSETGGTRDKSRAEVLPDERRRHAELIRDLLVAINRDYRQRYGTPPPLPSAASDARRTTEKDVEMVAAV